MRLVSLCKDTSAFVVCWVDTPEKNAEVVVGQQVWAGVDAGKSEHYCVVIDADGQRLLSQRRP
jgi:hypothetical protein